MQRLQSCTVRAARRCFDRCWKCLGIHVAMLCSQQWPSAHCMKQGKCEYLYAAAHRARALTANDGATFKPLSQWESRSFQSAKAKSAAASSNSGVTVAVPWHAGTVSNLGLSVQPAMMAVARLAWACAGALPLFAIAADRVVFQLEQPWRALADSATHALIAMLLWLIASAGVVPERELVAGCVLSLLSGSALDADHFLSARSASLDSALHLPGRPLGHALPVAVLLAAMVEAGAALIRRHARWLWMPRWPGAMCLLAWVSHQLRDACRRGMWLWPAPWSIPVPYAMYVLLLPALGLAARRCLARAVVAHKRSRRAHVDSPVAVQLEGARQEGAA